MKAFFFDYDGTIVDDITKEISQGTLYALQALYDHGDMVFINTGRTKAILDPICATLPIHGMILGCGTYITYGKDLLLHEPVKECDHEAILQIFQDAQIDAFLEGDEYLYITEHIQSPSLLNILARYKKNNVKVKSVQEANKSFSKLFICYRDPSKEEQAKQALLPYFTYIERGEHRAELVPRGYSKATGIQVILDHLHIDKKDCYVFGDSNNDIPMFEYIENSILIGGGENPELANQVMMCSESAGEDGILHALERLELL